MSAPAILDAKELGETIDAARVELFRRGIVASATTHAEWMVRYWTEWFVATGEGETQVRPLPTGVLSRVRVCAAFRPDPADSTRSQIELYFDLPMLRRLRFRTSARGRAPAGVTLGVLRVASTALSLVRDALGSVPRFLPRIGRSLLATIRAVPALLVAVSVVFVTGDAWRIFGRPGLDGRFLIVAASGFTMALLFSGRWHNTHLLAEIAASRSTTTLPDHPAAPLGVLQHLLHTRNIPIEPVATTRSLRANLAVLYWFAIVASLLAVAFAVTITLIVFGAVRLDVTTTAGLLDQPPHQLFRVPFTTLVITRELLAVSVTLGALSTLFAAAAVQQQEPRTQLLGRSLDRIRLALDDFAVYQTARDHTHDLIASSIGPAAAGAQIVTSTSQPGAQTA